MPEPLFWPQTFSNKHLALNFQFFFFSRPEMARRLQLQGDVEDGQRGTLRRDLRVVLPRIHRTKGVQP